MLKQPFPFENRMSRRGLIAGLVYFPIHVFVLPVILPSLLINFGIEDEGLMNLVYYGLGILVVLCLFMDYLRGQYDGLLDRLGLCVLSFFMALGMDYLLSLAANSLVLALTGGAVDNPNEAAISEIVLRSSGAMKAVGIFMAPIVEEVLFRGVVFGGLREKNRLAAYAVSMLMFALYHIWQFAAAAGDVSMLVYVIQYLPVGFVLCWLYERSNTVWLPIGFHMMINAMGFAAENILEEMI